MPVSEAKTSSGRQTGVQRGKSAATRAALIAAARSCFAEAGYHATGTHNLVSLTSVSRGALYYHFGDKFDIFEAVFLEIDEELNRAARNAVTQMSNDTWLQLVTALATYLRLRAESREAGRILLIDGPAVFGWERWRELQSGALEGMAITLGMLMDQGIIGRQPPEPLARLIFAATNEAALAIAHAADPEAALVAHTHSLLTLVQGLRLTPEPVNRFGGSLER